MIFLVAPLLHGIRIRSKFQNLIAVRVFEKSGHTVPQYEEPELFDDELLRWLSLYAHAQTKDEAFGSWKNKPVDALGVSKKITLRIGVKIRFLTACNSIYICSGRSLKQRNDSKVANSKQFQSQHFFKLHPE